MSYVIKDALGRYLKCRAPIFLGTVYSGCQWSDSKAKAIRFDTIDDAKRSQLLVIRKTKIIRIVAKSSQIK